MNISATIITLNEEQNIERCLTSLKGVVDEIVVLDSCSTDRTEEMCKAHHVVFHTQPFAGYIQQKNDVANLASHPWILNIDADEALSDQLKKSILDWKEHPSTTTFGFLMNRITNYCGIWIHHSGWYPDKQLRLYHRDYGQFEGKYIHEKVVIKENAVARLKGDILHYSYYTIDEHLKQADKFTDLTAKAAFENGRSVSWLGIYIKSGFKFFRNYIIKLGFLDGRSGFTVCRITAHSTYLKYSKLRTLNRNNK